MIEALKVLYLNGHKVPGLFINISIVVRVLSIIVLYYSVMFKNITFNFLRHTVIFRTQ